MKILLIGDIVGRPGREAVKKIVPELRKQLCLDFVIANGENIAGGSGMTPATIDEIFSSGVDAVTSGDHIWKKKEIFERLDKDNRVLRPANFPAACPGRGSVVLKTSGAQEVAIINLQGRVFMKPIGCPFSAAGRELEKIKTRIVLVDMHAEATSEKIAMGRFLDNRVTCVFGTHTHVQTADERILRGGTGYITDIGMTGAQDSVIGRKTSTIIDHFLTCMPAKFEVADREVELQGGLLDIDEVTGKCLSIRRVREPLERYT